MSQLSLSLDTPLMVRDGRGRYRPADADQILEAARQVIEQKMQRGEAFTSPVAVKDYLRAKLAGFEHEVFAVLFLDTRHRVEERRVGNTCVSKCLSRWSSYYQKNIITKNIHT